MTNFTVLFDINGVLARGNWSLADDSYHPTQPIPIELIPAGIEILKACNNSSSVLKTFGPTNCTQQHITFLHRHVPELTFELNGIIAAGSLAWKKPNYKAFLFASHAYKLDPHTCIFIDDSPINIEAANNFGMIGILFDESVKVMAQLVELGAI